MKNPKVLYILISLFCIFAIIAGIYAQYIESDQANTNLAQEDEKIEQEKTQEKIKADFNNLFINELNLGGFDTTGIAKINNEHDIVYSAIDREEVTENYEINIHIPVINIKNELANTYNSMTQADFINKANDVMQNTDKTKKAIYSIDYAAYVNNNILALVIFFIKIKSV